MAGMIEQVISSVIKGAVSDILKKSHGRTMTKRGSKNPPRGGPRPAETSASNQSH